MHAWLFLVAFPLAQSVRTDHWSTLVAEEGPDNKLRYLASLLFAVGDAAAEKGASLIIDRRKAGDGKAMPGGDWSSTFLEDIARRPDRPRCLLFVDLGGGSLTGELFALSSLADRASYERSRAKAYKSKDHTDVAVPGLVDAYDTKGTFSDYSGKTGEDLRRYAELLARHIKAAHSTGSCDEEHHLAEKVFIRQTGKIRYVELSKAAGDRAWEPMMRAELAKLFGSVSVDYGLLESDTEAKYEGACFWTHNFEAFRLSCAEPRPTKDGLILVQIGSSSTQASTCRSTTCDVDNVVAAGHGVLGAIPSEEQLARACVDGANCYPELKSRFMGVLEGAGIDRLSSDRTVALLNAVGYSVAEMYDQCDKRAEESMAAQCQAIRDAVRKGERVQPGELRDVAAWLGGFPTAPQPSRTPCH